MRKNKRKEYIYYYYGRRQHVQTVKNYENIATFCRVQFIKFFHHCNVNGVRPSQTV